MTNFDTTRLETGSGAVDVIGELLTVDLHSQWTADDAFFDMLRDKQTIRAMLAEVAGKRTVDAHATATGKVMKGIIKDCLAGDNGREKVSAWVPKYLRFPAAVNARKAGIASLGKASSARKAFKKAKA